MVGNNLGVFEISLSSICHPDLDDGLSDSPLAQKSLKIVCSQEKTTKNTNQSITLTTCFSKSPLRKVPRPF